MPGVLGCPAEINIMSAPLTSVAFSQEVISTFNPMLEVTWFSSSAKAAARFGFTSQRVILSASFEFIIV